MAITKVINSESQAYRPVLTDTLVLDAVPTVNSFNSVTSDAVARAVAGASGEVPQVTENDNGKVLTAIYDEGGAAVEWAAAPSELPDTTGASQGDVLSIGSSGLEWATPSAGGDDVVVLTYGTSTWSDVLAAYDANKRLAVQGTYGNYQFYSDDVVFIFGVMVSWCVAIPATYNAYRIKLLANGNWLLEELAELPSTVTASAGQVLSLNNNKEPSWTTPSGGSSFALTKVGTVTDYLPTTGAMALSFTSVSGQSNFVDPTKLYMLKVKISCVDSGSLSFGSAPYLTLSSFNTEYNAVNRTHLSYAVPQIGSYSMSDSASTNTPVYFFDEVANSLHIAPTGGQENDLKIVVGGVYSGSANSHRITIDLYMVN